jgi:ketosteroid isomerase-like protein
MTLSRFSVLSLVLFLAAPSGGDDSELPEALRGLVAAERAFSKFSVDRGIKPAFLQFLGDDAIVFAPRATRGRKAYEEQPDEPEPRTTLVWSPSFADIAASGDFGYTTGPYELSFVREGKTVKSYGHYVTVWKKTSDDRWKVAIDKGIRHPDAAKTTEEVGYPKDGTRDDGRARLDELMALDRAFAERGFEGLASESVRLYRDGAFPVVGKSDSLAQLGTGAKGTVFTPEGGGIASTGDLGYTYGTASSESGVSSAYLHIWKREGAEWRLVLDNDTPLPSGS